LIQVAEAYFKHGYNQLRRRDLAIAIDDFTQVILLSDNDQLRSKAHFNRGIARYLQGNYEAAITDYTAALVLNPDFADAYYSRGGAYDDQGFLNAAIVNYEEALRLSPRRDDIYNDLGAALTARSHYPEAIKAFTNAILLGEDTALRAVAYYNRGNARYRAGSYEAAVTDLTAALRLDPTDAKSLSRRAAVYYELADYAAAADDCAAALSLDASNADAYFTRARVFTQHGDLTAALDDYRTVLKIGGQYYAEQPEIETAMLELKRQLGAA
jgi:tetratricopeptide (TPR) repeat protein